MCIFKMHSKGKLLYRIEQSALSDLESVLMDDYFVPSNKTIRSLALQFAPSLDLNNCNLLP